MRYLNLNLAFNEIGNYGIKELSDGIKNLN